MMRRTRTADAVKIIKQRYFAGRKGTGRLLHR